MKRMIIVFGLTLATLAAMAQIDTTKMTVPLTGVTIDTAKFGEMSSPTMNINGNGISGTSSTIFANGGTLKWVKIRTLWVAYPHREAWSIGAVDQNGNARVYVKRSMVHWLNDSTMYINTAVKKPVKHKNNIKHMRRLADGSFYLKELKPGETAVLTVPIKIK